MSEATGKEEATGRPPWIVQFDLQYNENGPSARWIQNREPDLLELALFQAQLFTKLLRGGIIFAGIEDQASASGIVTPSNGGNSPELTVLEGANANTGG